MIIKISCLIYECKNVLKNICLHVWFTVEAEKKAKQQDVELQKNEEKKWDVENSIDGRWRENLEK